MITACKKKRSDVAGRSPKREKNMGILTVKDVSKSFGQAKVLDNVSITVEEDEIFFILGPSGCGKTTLLRIITGFLTPDSGQVYLGERDITGLAPANRNIGMVFQNYALWPHMTVWQNVAYGLEVKKVAEDMIKSKTDRVLEITKLAPFRDKFPPHLSGGQQQRVALARAIIAEPGVLLLDEPLSNLDAKLREEMRSEIKRIQKDTGITMIYVTHDQKEAMSLGDRITVMNEGRIMQTGAPVELYSRPSNRFVASFLGDVNILPGKVAALSGGLAEIETSEGRLKAAAGGSISCGQDVEVAFRPENVLFRRGANSMKCKITGIEYYGETFRADCLTPSGKAIQLKVFAGESRRLAAGSEVEFDVEPQHLILFGEK